MLNYIWVALIVLGVGTALTTDLINNSSDKYRNELPFPITISFNDNITELTEGKQDVKVLVSASDFNNFYEDQLKFNSITLNGNLNYSKESNSGNLILKIDEKSPQIWREMAEASGQDDDLSGVVKIKERGTENSIKAEIVFESMSFARMQNVTDEVINYAGTAVTIALGLIGIMALWLGVMKIAEDAGIIKIIAKSVKPITKRLFPDIPSDHPAISSIIMNISANMLGLGNAATPFGLKAMDEMEKINPNKGTASNSMVTFLAINTAGLTLIPATAIAVRAASGSSNPAIIIGTSIFGAFCATIAGITAAKFLEKFYLDSWKFSSWFKKNFKFFALTLVFIAAIILFFTTGLSGKFSSWISFFSMEGFQKFH